jgi:hypothetical protein
MAKRQIHLALTAMGICALCGSFATSAGAMASGGLKGEYFNGQWPYVPPVLTRIDPEIDFNWGEGPPAPGVNPDFFSVRWTGDLEAPFTGVYTFTVRTTDRVLLRIADRPVIGTAWPQSTVYEGTIELAAGEIYPLDLIYNAGKGVASVQLLWQSSTLPQEIVPGTILQLPLRARTPFPTDGATEVVQDTALQWNAGCKATHHDIYFGDDADAVASATVATERIYQGRQPFTTTAFRPSSLEWDKTYYWRVDEVNDAEPSSPWKGPVWSFTTADFLLVDDFESYTDDEGERIYETWIDGWFTGNGGIVGYLITDQLPVVHGGRDSMPFDYNNANPPYYSEAYRMWDKPQDWTVNGINDLSLWLKGRTLALFTKPNGNVVLGVPATSSAWGGSIVSRFAYKELTGDGEVLARIEYIKGDGRVVEAGLMIRETADSNSRYAALGLTVEQTLFFERRLIRSGNRVRDDQPDIAAPHWPKLTRTRNTLAAQHCTDGANWQDIRDAQGRPVVVDMAMPGTVCMGLYMVGRTQPGNGTAEFSHTTFNGSISAEWWVDNAWRGNSPEDIYVALEDANGITAVAVNPDPWAVNAADWTQWRIPLSEFITAGVNVKAIKRMYIGVGDRENPQPGGSGMIWIDDLRVIRSTAGP